MPDDHDHLRPVPAPQPSASSNRNVYFTKGCPKWSDGKHNFVVFRGLLPWRLYDVCVSCGHKRRHP